MIDVRYSNEPVSVQDIIYAARNKYNTVYGARNAVAYELFCYYCNIMSRHAHSIQLQQRCSGAFAATALSAAAAMEYKTLTNHEI